MFDFLRDFLLWSKIQDFLIDKFSGNCYDCGTHSWLESHWENANGEPLGDPIVLEDLALLCRQCYGNRHLCD